jgi:hypothetical protein
MKTKITLLVLCLLTFVSMVAAQKKKAVAEVTPDQVVKNLYAARKSPKTDPFFQNKSRALLDKYFTKNFADVIWKDATTQGDGVGALNFDPLFYAQDSDITNFVIGKADGSDVVKVKFKNFGKAEEIKFFLAKENTASKVWKIDTIMYSDAEDLGSLIEYAMMSEDEMKAAESENKLNGDYMVGTVKCNITSNISGYWARVKCDDQENFQVIDTETMTFGTFNPNEKGRKGQFISPEYGVIEKFVDASGKEFKVTKLEDQPKVCGLNLEITETNIKGLPIQNATATAINLETNATLKAALFEAMPVFNDLTAGKYKITVMKNGYQTLVKEVELECNNLQEDDRMATEYVFLKKGK